MKVGHSVIHRGKLVEGSLRVGQIRHRRGQSGPQRHAEESHRHAPAPVGAPAGARQIRRPAGQLRRTRLSAVRLHVPEGPDGRRACESRAARPREDRRGPARHVDGAGRAKRRRSSARWPCSARSTAARSASCASAPRTQNHIDEAFSREFCGGTHVDRLGVIGGFKILKEESVSAGVRRITALTGQGLTAHLEQAGQYRRTTHSLAPNLRR